MEQQLPTSAQVLERLKQLEKTEEENRRVRHQKRIETQRKTLWDQLNELEKEITTIAFDEKMAPEIRDELFELDWHVQKIRIETDTDDSEDEHKNFYQIAVMETPKIELVNRMKKMDSEKILRKIAEARKRKRWICRSQLLQCDAFAQRGYPIRLAGQMTRKTKKQIKTQGYGVLETMKSNEFHYKLVPLDEYVAAKEKLNKSEPIKE
jgi:hypothetical protein